jgi:hypothetical protein
MKSWQLNGDLPHGSTTTYTVSLQMSGNARDKAVTR